MNGRSDRASDLRRLLDTGVAIALRDGDSRLLSREEESTATGLLSVISIVELEGGVLRSEEGRRVRLAALDALYETVDILPFTVREARLYGKIVERLGFARVKITDRMIAATALAANVPLATLNARDFRDIPDLQIEDWFV